MFQRSGRLSLLLLVLLGVASACGDVAKERQVSPAANAGSAAVVDAGVDAPLEETEPVPIGDASSADDAGAADSCPSDSVFCCDSWTGERSTPTCVAGFSDCGRHLDMQVVDSECLRTPDVCHVESTQELDGKACSSAGLLCPFGRGCSSCRCECQVSTLLWRCECTAC